MSKIRKLLSVFDTMWRYKIVIRISEIYNLRDKVTIIFSKRDNIHSYSFML